MFDRRLFLSAGAGGLVSAALAPADARAQGQVITMAFAMNGDRPVTTCFIGDQGPFLMLIDSGNAVLCSLRDDILQRLNLRRIGSERVYGATGTDVQIAYEAPEVVFGQAVREKDVTFLALKMSPQPLQAPGAPIRHAVFDGILPLALLTARPTDLDFTKGEVRIQYTGSVDRTGFRPLRSERVRQTGSAFIVTCMVDGAQARLVVDTGANTTVSLHPGFVTRHGLWTKHPRYLELGIGGVTGASARARLVRSPEVQIGAYRFRDVPVMLSDPKLNVLDEVDGLLGIEFLRRFTVGFDAGASTLWLKPNDRLAEPYPYDHSGLTWDFRNGRAVVLSAAPGSPAEEIGLKPGDVLPQFRSVAELARFDARLGGEPGTEFPLEVERDGQRFSVKLVLKDWL